MLIKRLIGKLLGRSFRTQLSIFKILITEYRQFRSIKLKRPLFSTLNNAPWYTYPAIEFIKGLDTSGMDVFEWGSGYSSLFWAEKGVSEIISVEDHEEWYNEITLKKHANNRIVLLKERSEYVNAIEQENKKFDIIIVDGKYRLDCSLKAIPYLKEGGIIVLDNSDWFVKSAEYLRSSGLIQVDFAGFGPINGYTWVTSVFFSRAYNFKPIGKLQPEHCIGGIKQYADET